MFKYKFFSMFMVCSYILYCNFGVVSAEKIAQSSTTIYLTGEGIANRLHKPILEEFSNVNIEYIHIPEDPTDTDNIVCPSDAWLFLGTPVYKHKQNILCSSKKYKKILCEKPVGISINEINQIKDTLKQNEVLFRVNYALRFLPCLEEINEFIKNNNIKSLTITCNANFNKTPPNKACKSNYKLGGGILYSILPHMIDLLNFLNCEENLNSIIFQSSTNVPMNDIKVYSRTLNGIDTAININLCEDFDELTLKVETLNKVKVFDLINSSENKISENRYCNGTLSATSKISPWRISFKNLLKTLFINPEDYRIAKIEDAEKVHDVLDIILSRLE